MLATARPHLTAPPEPGAPLALTVPVWMKPPVAAPPELTPREQDILRSIANGDTVRLTARTLGIAEKTVENTQARLFRKLGVHNRPGALAAAHAVGLLPQPASGTAGPSRSSASMTGGAVPSPSATRSNSCSGV